jgi:hypothetical protein
MTTTTQEAAALKAPLPPLPILDPRFQPPNILGQVEVNEIAGNILSGRVSARVRVEDATLPTYIIDADDDWFVDVHWDVTGQLAPMVCGKFCVRIILENLGPGGEDFEQEIPHMLEMVPCQFKYDTTIKVPAGKVQEEWCGTPYKAVAVVTYLTNCHSSNYRVYGPEDSRSYKPGPWIGTVELPLMTFFLDLVEEEVITK